MRQAHSSTTIDHWSAGSWERYFRLKRSSWKAGKTSNMSDTRQNGHVDVLATTSDRVIEEFKVFLARLGLDDKMLIHIICRRQ
jgi:hypothetical protein